MFFIPIPFIFNNHDKVDKTSKDRVNIFKTLNNSGYIDDSIIRHTQMLIEVAQLPIIDVNATDEERERILREHKINAEIIMAKIKSNNKYIYGF